MEKVPYTTNPANVKRFFQTIQGLGKPNKVNRPYLKNIGFKSSSDNYLPTVSKFLRFVDEDNVPTERWNAYKNKDKAPIVMADAIKSAYDELFGTYPDANKRDSATIQNYFASKYGVSARLAELMEQTFRQLCGLADFGAVPVVERVDVSAPTLKKVVEIPTGVTPITININIQLSLPATEDAAIYDSLFSALKKHLFS